MTNKFEHLENVQKLSQKNNNGSESKPREGRFSKYSDDPPPKVNYILPRDEEVDHLKNTIFQYKALNNEMQVDLNTLRFEISTLLHIHNSENSNPNLQKLKK